MNRDDNMIYKSNIQAMERTGQTAAVTDITAAVTAVPEETAAETGQTTVTVTEPPKVTLSRELLDSYIYEDLEFEPYEYRYSNTVAFKNRSSVSDFSIPLTKKSFTISYEGIITAGFDREKIKVENDDDSYTIEITLPQVYIISHETDTQSFELENVQDNLFNPINPEDYLNACESQNYKMEQQALASGLFNRVYEQAEQQISEYINRDSIIGAKYSIVFIRPDVTL